MCYKQKCKVVSLNLAHPVVSNRAFLSRICHCTNERRRREDRGAEGGAEAEGVGSGDWVSPPLSSQTNLLNFIGPQVASD